MPATILEAREQVLGRLKTTLDASSITQAVKVLWEDDDDEPADGEGASSNGEPWLEVSVRLDPGGRPVTIGGSNAKRRYKDTGTLVVQVFTPSGDGTTLASQITQVILDGFRSGGATSGGIQFRSSGAAPAGRDGAFTQTNVLVGFEFDQFSGP